MEPIDLPNGRSLRPVVLGDLDEIHALICEQRDHLAPWMPWARQPKDETAAFLAQAVEQETRDEGVQLAITERGRIIGVCGFHAVNRRDLSTSLGYWLAAPAQGQGTVTLAVEAMLELAFGEWGMHRAEIRAAVGNARSRSVPERLGFTQEGVLREAERFADRYKDLVVYSLLAPEWRART